MNARTIRNEKGILTFDFIFALFLGMAFTMVFFALTMTLSYVEVAQYISFSVARVAYGAHETRSLQLQLANSKYTELRNRPVFKVIFSRGWFTIPAQPSFGDPLKGFNDEYNADPAADSDNFIGARLTVNAKILNMSNPVLGSTQSQEETGVANIQTFLGREVTTQECRDGFNRQRLNNIITLKSPSGATPYANAVNFGANAALITDNGC